VNPKTIWKHFDVLVLMAEEAQPDMLVYPGKKVLRAPIDDGDLTERDERRIARILPDVIAAIRTNKRVLVTCMAGRNRSGIVVALALVHLLPCWTSDKIISLIRMRRKAFSGPAMSNPAFVERVRQERVRVPMRQCA
jgi:protein-tyrosine phosphatase